MFTFYRMSDSYKYEFKSELDCMELVCLQLGILDIITYYASDGNKGVFYLELNKMLNQIGSHDNDVKLKYNKCYDPSWDFLWNGHTEKIQHQDILIYDEYNRTISKTMLFDYIIVNIHKIIQYHNEYKLNYFWRPHRNNSKNRRKHSGRNTKRSQRQEIKSYQDHKGAVHLVNPGFIDWDRYRCSLNSMTWKNKKCKKQYMKNRKPAEITKEREYFY